MGADTNATFSSQFKEEMWYSLFIDKRMYCKYLGECDVEHSLNDGDYHLCLYCVHREPLDIPKMIYEAKKEKMRKLVEEEDGKI